MSLYTYDLHVHSCLSPCGDEDNTPNNLAGMATLNNIQIMALTDHNTTKNCPAFFAACKRYGIIPIPGMELTTSEEIHVVCLFPTLEDAMAFNEAVDGRREKFPNRTDIFGEQLILDGDDNVIGSEPDFLTNATTISLDEAPLLVEQFHGVCYPAHIDRSANGIIAILGTFPKELPFVNAELHFAKNEEQYRRDYGLEGKRILVSSDAHYLTDLREDNASIEIPDGPYSSALVRENLIRILKSKPN
ncbi:MAG: PHP domain-containing protein [Lachnospiraceae bacterium]|nr:PHP domain-containing protein [Lachnospiraceae bacterium]